MIDIESKIISCREDTNDYRLCLTREEIEEIKQALNKQENILAKCWENKINILLHEYGISMYELGRMEQK